MFRSFFTYYRPHRLLFLADFGCAVIAGLLELGFPFAVRVYVDELLPSANWTLIVAAAAALLAVYMLSAGLNAIVVYFGHMLGINIETELRRRAFDHLQKLSFRYFDNQKSGNLVAHLTKDLEEIGEIAHHGPEDLFIAVMTFVGAFLMMLSVNVQLALITAAIVPAVAWITASFGGRMTQNWHQLFGRVAGFNVRIEENVGGMRVVQAFANEDHERQLFAVDNSAYRTTKLAAYRLMAATNALSFLSMRIVQLVVLIAGSRLVILGELTAGGFVGFLLLVGVFFRPVEKINAVIETYPKGIAGFRRYLAFLATEPDIADRPGAVEAPAFRGHVLFEAVGFGYSGDRPLLEEIDLDIAAGETIAFVGPSGVGKTTLCSLLPRFYEVTAGAIRIDGRDIRDMTVASLRRQIGIVQQDVFLFGGTIRENIAYGRLEASDAEIAAAAERAQLGDMLAELPDGLDTIVGERGVKLSGGQKQRIAIARMFLKDPPILILDEATSALDTATEREIQASLAELARGRTTLIIAHRLSTIRNADRIVVVEAEGIGEQGSHEELMQLGGSYARLYSASNAA